MKRIHPVSLLMLAGVFAASPLQAQQDTSWCKVLIQSLVGNYTGGCKMGKAEGDGYAKGLEHYKGSFKNGYPNGNGTWYYNDTVYHTGSFQDGVKEGKGETHYSRKGMPDSVISGYWSGDEYRGKKYTTYSFSTSGLFDQIEITPSSQSGKTITVETSTTSGTPNGASVPGLVLYVTLVSPNGCILHERSRTASSLKNYVTYELVSFPCQLFGTISNGENFQLDLYKAANWRVRLYQNQ